MEKNDFEDLSELCTKGAEDEGVWEQVVLYGKPRNLRALIYGETSDAVQRQKQEKLRGQLKSLNISRRGGRLDLDEEGVDEIASDDGIDSCLVRLGGLSRMDGSPLKFNGQDVPVIKDGAGAAEIYAGILRGMPELADFIMATAQDRQVFLPGRKRS